MAPRKRRGVGLVKGSITPPLSSSHAVNTHGFAALPDEMYLEIVSHLPSVPILTTNSIPLESYPEIRRVRHEALLSLTQTSRSLRRFFLRYLWQHIEVREGVKIGSENGTLNGTRSRTRSRTRTRTAYLGSFWDITEHNKYATELGRQLEIVTIRNPLLAQYVNYLDIFIGEYSIATVLAELARCLSLFPNLHTVQIDVSTYSRRKRSLREIFEKTFEKYSYPQIRNVFVMFYSISFVASCPQARRVGCTHYNAISSVCLQTMQGNCPHLEVLESFGDVYWTPDACIFVANNFPNLHTIQFDIMIYPLAIDGNPSHINIFMKMNHLQTIIMRTPSPRSTRFIPAQEETERVDRIKEEWIEAAKRVLIHIQLRDNFEKTVVVRDCGGNNERRIVIKPKSSVDLERLRRFA